MDGNSLNDPKAFAASFLERSTENGLGSLSKRDVDILVFYLLLADGRYALPRDMFKACRELKLTEAKVRNLYQEAQLRYMQYDELEARVRFIKLVEKESIERKGDKLTFIVREPLLRQYLEEWVAGQDGFTDSSFNKNLVTLSVGTFAAVIEELAGDNFDDIKGKFEDELEPLNEANSLKDLAKLFAEEFAKSAGKEAGAFSIKGIVAGLKLLLLKVAG